MASTQLSDRLWQNKTRLKTMFFRQKRQKPLMVSFWWKIQDRKEPERL